MNNGNMVAKQIIDLLKQDDVDSFIYLMQSISPHLNEFWDFIVYIQATALIFEMSTFLDTHDSINDPNRKQLIQNLFIHLEAAERYCMDQGEYELIWILPALKIIHSPETIVIKTKIIYRQELANFLETDIKQLPDNLGTFILEIVISLLMKARQEIIELQETAQTLTLLNKYLEILVQNRYISNSQFSNLRLYFLVFFELPTSLEKEDMLLWIEQQIRSANAIDSNNLLPYEQLRLDIVKISLEISRIRLMIDSDNYFNLLRNNLDSSYQCLQNIKQTGLIYDQALLLRNILESLNLVVQEPKFQSKDKIEYLRRLSQEGMTYANQLRSMIDYLEPTVTLNFSNSILSALATFAPRLTYKSKEIFKANRIMLEMCQLSLEKNRRTLNQPHQLSGDFFYQLSLVYYAIGRYSPLNIEDRIRALKNALTYASQASSIYQFVSSSDRVKAIALEFEIGSRYLFIMSENPLETYNELDAINHEVMRSFEEVTKLIIKSGQWQILNKLAVNDSLGSYIKKALKLSRNEKINQKLINLQVSIMKTIDKNKYPMILQALQYIN